ncbi:hypothetical protein [Parvibaculum sp.]|jgi:hypothetical protein|uniref:hypothetical protein n=1 Tax=Parvibaculum sp. TaxID=2024848 RepID=UPI001B16855E|nr:hypothetical protein [Parvibaculum sp.]MBO6635160.1 hypothetical protein [Parvibaculum sp.]MBO6678588.1 hypothetical protein [Parvibaculum sp.]MBO6684097.1 hypothetical protein [Parvibaculum sp.]
MSEQAAEQCAGPLQEPSLRDFGGEIEFSRAACDVFLRLDAQTRRLVSLAAAAEGTREIAPGIFSTDAGPSLRVVFRRTGGLTSVLALTGRSAA